MIRQADWGQCMTTNRAVAVIEEPDGRSFEAKELDFVTIESAVMETIRGRWFLKEYARRHRHADTEQVLAAIDKLARRMAQPSADADMDRIRMDLKEMAEAISTTRHEIAAISPDSGSESQILMASGELDSIVSETEQATSGILEAAEQVQEAAWIMREDGVNPDMCDTLDGLATRIYTACSFQDITGQRTGKVIEALQSLEQRIHAMSEIWDVESWTKTDAVQAQHASESSPETEELSGQSDVDQVMIDTETAMDLEVGETDSEDNETVLEADPEETEFLSAQEDLISQLPVAEIPDSEVAESIPDEDEPQEDVCFADLSDLEDAIIPDDDPEQETSEPEDVQPAPQGAAKTPAINMSTLSRDDMHALFYC